MKYTVVVDNGEKQDEQVEVECDPRQIEKHVAEIAAQNVGRPCQAFRSVGRTITAKKSEQITLVRR